MEIPFSSLTRSRSKRVITKPNRGDLCGIKLVRYGALKKDGSRRIVSTYNSSIPFNVVYLCGHNAQLFFEERNLLINQSAAWESKGSASIANNVISMNTGDSLTQKISVRKNQYYTISAQEDLSAITFSINDTKIAHTGFWASADEVVSFKLSANKSVKINDLSIEFQPGEEPLGPICLTNNYKRPERNLNTSDPTAPMGSYLYVTLDDNDEFKEEDHPDYRNRGWKYDNAYVVPDVGGMKGWIPFDKGSLTGDPSIAFWQTDKSLNVKNIFTNAYGRHAKTVMDIDLGKNYYVTGLDVLWPGPFSSNLEVWGRADGEDAWVYLHSHAGRFVEKSKRKDQWKGFDNIRELNSVVRYLRWRGSSPDVFYPQQAVMDGIQEIWVWGQPVGNHKLTEKKPFVPYVDTVRKPRTEPVITQPYREETLIIPRPIEMTRLEAWFHINQQTSIQYEASSNAAVYAEDMKAEIGQRFAVSVSHQAANDTNRASANSIYLGIPSLNKQAAAIASSMKIDMEKLGAQGYALFVDKERIVILGADEDGLYWGVQSLMFGMRWCNDLSYNTGTDAGTGGLAFQAMQVYDWPETLERAYGGHSNRNFIFQLPYSERARMEKMIKLCTRLKYNIFYLNYEHHGGDHWPQGAFTAFIADMGEKYHMEVRPYLIHHQGEGGNTFRYILKKHNALDLAERFPDEVPNELGSFLNLNPFKAKSMQLLFEHFDDSRDKFAQPSCAIVQGLIYTNSLAGSRWGASPEFKKSGMTPDEGFAYYLRHIADYLRERNMRAVIGMDFFRDGPRKAKDSRMVTIDITDVPEEFIIDLKHVHGMKSADMIKKIPYDRRANGPKDVPCIFRSGFGGVAMSQVIHLSLLGTGSKTYKIKKDRLMRTDNIWRGNIPVPERALNELEYDLAINELWQDIQYPSMNRGAKPEFHTIDLRTSVNHPTAAVGNELMIPGYPEPIDYSYLKPGLRTFCGIEFDIIDPVKNNKKTILMLGRPPKNVSKAVLPLITDHIEFVAVNKKLSSISFLYSKWLCKNINYMNSHGWLKANCRVLFDDDTWVVVDSHAAENWNFNRCFWWNLGGDGVGQRLAWKGNQPTGKLAKLTIMEWVNPYPDKTIKGLSFVMPEMDHGKGAFTSYTCEAILGITGIVTTTHDIAMWKDKAKPSLFPIIIDDSADHQEIISSGRIDNSGAYQGNLKTVDGQVTYTISSSGTSKLRKYLRYTGIENRDAFKKFTATLAFNKPITLSKIECLGPMHFNGMQKPHHTLNMPKQQKVDVLIEYSEDGSTWKKLGELKSICALVDFMPINFTAQTFTHLRFTADSTPYKFAYKQNGKQGLFGSLLNSSPHFGWRLFEAAKK
ncbi:MAG: hypothetical protein HRU15_15645 [Planctomycetes bacterium]|nr:hypothetical protein [Planctomycetota bacterium]